VTGQRHLVTIDSSTVACKFRQPTDDNASGGNKSADKLASVFMIWGQGVVVSCTKFPHQSYANHFHKYFAVTAATGTLVPLSKHCGDRRCRSLPLSAYRCVPLQSSLAYVNNDVIKVIYWQIFPLPRSQPTYSFRRKTTYFLPRCVLTQVEVRPNSKNFKLNSGWK